MLSQFVLARICTALLPAMLVLGAGGCATTKLPITQAYGPGVAPGATLGFADARTEGLAGENMPRLTAEFERAGFRFSDQPQFLIDLGAARPTSAIGVQPADPELALHRAKPQRPRLVLFGACRGQIYKLTLSLAERTTGSIAHRGASEMRICDKQREAGLNLLVKALVQSVSNPAAAE